MREVLTCPYDGEEISNGYGEIRRARLGFLRVGNWFYVGGLGLYFVGDFEKGDRWWASFMDDSDEMNRFEFLYEQMAQVAAYDAADAKAESEGENG